MNLKDWVNDAPETALYKDRKVMQEFVHLLSSNEHTKYYLEEVEMYPVEIRGQTFYFTYWDGVFNIALSQFSCHTPFMGDVPTLLDNMKTVIDTLCVGDMSDTPVAFSTFSGNVPTGDPRLLFIDSPQSITYATREELIASLPTKKRDRLKNTLKNNPIELVHESPDLDRIASKLIDFWSVREPDSVPTVLSQLFFTACDPTSQFVVTDKATAYFEVREENGVSTPIFQGMCRDNESNVGVPLLVECNKELHHRGFGIMDTTVNLELDDHDPYKVYKRCITNSEKLRPLLFAARNAEGAVAPYFEKDTWHV